MGICRLGRAPRNMTPTGRKWTTRLPAIRARTRLSQKPILESLVCPNKASVPSSPLRSLHKSSPPTVLDYSCALAQGDWCPGPALTCGQVRCLRNWKVLDAGQVLYDVLAVSIPRIDAVSETADSLSPFLFAPFFLLFPFHGRCIRVLHFEPVGRASRTVGGILPLRDDAFGPSLQAWRKTISPSPSTCAAFLRAITRKSSCLISCSHWPPDGSLSVLVGRRGAMKPAGRLRGRDSSRALSVPPDVLYLPIPLCYFQKDEGVADPILFDYALDNRPSTRGGVGDRLLSERVKRPLVPATGRTEKSPTGRPGLS
jgi:hypothetical protein